MSRKRSEDSIYAGQLDKVAKSIHKAKRRFNASNHFNLKFDAEARYAITAIGNNDSLLKCPLDSIEDAMVDIAIMGLSLDPAKGEAALVDRWHSKRKSAVCRAVPMYRGLIHRATDSGSVSSVSAQLVFECEEDSFEVDLGDNPYVRHKAKLFVPRSERVIDFSDEKRNKLIGAYCVATLPNGAPHITIMDITEITEIAGRSEAFKPTDGRRSPFGPWVTDPGEMVKKSVIKRASKMWPVGNGALMRVVEIDNNADVDEQTSRIKQSEVDGASGKFISKKQVEIIKDLAEQQELEVSFICNNYKIPSLVKMPVKYYDDCHEKLRSRLSMYNDFKKKELDDEVPAK